MKSSTHSKKKWFPSSFERFSNPLKINENGKWFTAVTKWSKQKYLVVTRFRFTQHLINNIFPQILAWRRLRLTPLCYHTQQKKKLGAQTNGILCALNKKTPSARYFWLVLFCLFDSTMVEAKPLSCDRPSFVALKM